MNCSLMAGRLAIFRNQTPDFVTIKILIRYGPVTNHKFSSGKWPAQSLTGCATSDICLSLQ